MSPQQDQTPESPLFNHLIIGLEDKVVIGETRECHGAWYNAVLIVTSVLFLLYLVISGSKNVRKLWNGRSHIMISYYALLCLATFLNLAWSSLQGWQCDYGKEIAWNFLSIFTASAMLFLEVSLVAFLLQDSYTSGMENLARTFVVSGSIVGVDILLKAIYVFGFGFPLFINVVDSGQRMKWGFWIIHKLVLTGIYCYILFVHFSKWRERLPPRPAFYKYIIVMFIVNVIALFAAGLAVFGAGLGIWLFNLTLLCYHSLYLPFLYATFLAEFFQEEDFLLDNAYFSEMKDAGFFDADWD